MCCMTVRFLSHLMPCNQPMDPEQKVLNSERGHRHGKRISNVIVAKFTSRWELRPSGERERERERGGGGGGGREREREGERERERETKRTRDKERERERDRQRDIDTHFTKIYH